MLSNIKSIVNEDVSNKVVILRADLNIPLVNGVVQDQTRLKRLMPTINYLLENQSKLVICSHLGRPKGKFDEKFSLKPLVNVLSEITRAKVHFNSSCIGKEVLKQKKELEQGEILLLKLAQDLEELGKVEQLPKLESKKMIMIMSPKKNK